MNNVLPQGWTISNVAQVIEDMSPGFACGEKNVEKGFPHLRMNNIGEDGNLILDLLRKVPREKVKSQNILQKGDLLICTTNSSKLVGKVALFNLPGEYAFSNHLTRLRPNSQKILREFLKWNLWFQWKSGVFDDKCKHWVNQSTIPKEVLREIEIILPALDEQHRIVAKLEPLLAKVDACRERLSKIPSLLKRFRQSVLAAACSGRLTADWRKNNPSGESIVKILESIYRKHEAEAKTAAQRKKLRDLFANLEESDSSELPEGWRFVALSKLCESLNYGTSTKSQPSGKVSVLRMGNIQSGKIDWTDLVYTSDDDEIQKYSLRPNTVLFNRTNSPELVGKTAIYRGERPAIFAGYLIRINQLPELEPEYLNLCLNTNYAKEFCLHIKTDGVSQSNINAQKLGAFNVPFCPLLEQQEIVRRVEALFKIADRIEERYQKAKAHIDKLTRSHLAKAFRGELVPQDPNDEPASLSLNRIRQENKKDEHACKNQ